MLHAPVLQLNFERMHEIDPRNVESLFGMWTVFSKCADTIPDGKRLENLSWRVWARETLCCPPQPDQTIVPDIDIPLPAKEEVPSLSNSPGSESDSDSLRSLANSALSKSRGKEPHLTPHTLEKIITNITTVTDGPKVKELGPEIEAIVGAKMLQEKANREQQQSPVSDRSEQRSVNYTTESSCLSSMTANTLSTERGSAHRNSDTSVSSDGMIRSGSVVHGFSPVPSLRSRNGSTVSKNLPIVATKNAAKPPALKPTGMFTLGGSSEDDESSFEAQMSYRRHLLEPRKSSLSQSLTENQIPPQKKTTSFREVVEQHNIQKGSGPANDNAIASDDEDEDSTIDDSAIEDEDEDVWEDEQPEEEKPAVEPIFRRVDSTAHLQSRRSVLTAGLNEGDRAKGLLAAACKSSPALKRMNQPNSQNGPPSARSPDQNDEGMMMRPSGRPIAVPPPSNEQVYAMAHSPRTTRRHMLSTELTESLRKNLLWERQQKNTTVNAFLKRQAASMANLSAAGRMAAAQPHRTLQHMQHPHSEMANHEEEDVFNVADAYHTKGW